MMDNNNFKKSVFGGFDRNEVMSSIEQISQKYKVELDEVQSQKNKLQASLETLTKDYNEKIEHIKKLQQLVIKQNADNDRLKQLNIAAERQAQQTANTISQSSQDHSEQMSALNDRIVKLNDDNDALTRERDELQAQIELNSEKIKRIDEAGFTAEKLVSEAQNRSTQTLAEANNKVSAILTEAAKKAKEKLDLATIRSNEIIAKATAEADRIKNIAQDYNQQTKRKINDITSEISEREKRANIRSAEIVREATLRGEEIIKAAKARVVEANKQYDSFTSDVSGIKIAIREMLNDFEAKLDDAGYAMPDNLADDELFAQEFTPQVKSESEDYSSSEFEQQIKDLNNVDLLDLEIASHDGTLAIEFETQISELSEEESKLADELLASVEEEELGDTGEEYSV